jgi:hypothetical protein
MTLHFSQMGFTEGLTFMGNTSFFDRFSPGSGLPECFRLRGAYFARQVILPFVKS